MWNKKASCSRKDIPAAGGLAQRSLLSVLGVWAGKFLSRTLDLLFFGLLGRIPSAFLHLGQNIRPYAVLVMQNIE